MPQTVLVVGQGYVGLPLALRAVEAGYRVIGFDVDHGRTEALIGGSSYVEDITDEALAAALDTERFVPVSSLDEVAGFDIAVITVPTPLRDGVPDLSFVDEAGHQLAPLLRRGATVVLESTTYPGTTEERFAPALEGGSGLRAGVDFHLGYSPERIDPGNRVHTFVNTPKIVSGVDAASLAAVQAFYDDLVDTTVTVSSPKEAELTKLLENTFRHINIALVNELAVFAADLGIDIWEAIDAASTKPFGYMRFTPGPGVGGHCLPVDPSYLSWAVERRLGRSFRFVELANEVNEHMPDYVVRRVQAALEERGRSVRGSRVLLLGISFKANVGDWRESPSHRVAERFSLLGAELRGVDPHVPPDRFPPGTTPVALTAEELQVADAVVLLVDHGAFDTSLIATNARYVLDTKGHLPVGTNVERL